MKNQFIKNLENLAILVSQNQQETEQLASELFEPFKDYAVSLETHSHRWNEGYFREKLNDLRVNFSKEIINHLIEVKAHLQQKYAYVQQEKVVEQQNVDDQLSQPEVTSQAVKKEQDFAKPDLLNFKPNERLASLLAKGDVAEIRTYLMSMLGNRRLSLEEVGKSVWYVYQHKASVFEAEEESAFVQAIDYNEANWNKEYFNIQQVYLNKNFSLARLLHLVNVRETLMKKGDPSFQQIQVERKSEPKPETQPQHTQRSSSSTEQAREYVKPNSQSNYTQANSLRSQPESTQSDNNPFIKTVLLVGGAVLALFGAIYMIFK